MKKSFFSKILVLIFFLGGLSVNAQIRVKTNKSSNKVVKTNRSNSYNKGAVRVKNNKTPNRVVRNNRSNYYNNSKRKTTCYLLQKYPHSNKL